MNIYDFKVKDSFGNEISLSEYKGKVLLIVNTASKCGFTPQYEGLQKLYDKYGNEKFEILAFPCNQFGNQEPGDANEIKNFCSLTYNVSFPLFQKVDVNGKDADPLFEYLKESKSGFLSKNIKWNFTKFLVDSEGRVIDRFSPTTAPEKLEDKIKELIEEVK
jgi:glutathione peroxidase